jgi:phosphohistidine phosphatase SixA
MTNKFTELFYRMTGRRNAYRACFLDRDGNLTKAGRLVIEDLQRFCRTHQSTVVVSPVSRVVDTHATMLAEGRREVFNRLHYYLNLTEEQLLQIKDRSDE